jgi:hypothetical protein
VVAPSRRRRIVVWVLIAAATVLAFASALTVWVKRQALDTSAVTKASTQMLENGRVRGALSTYLVDQLYNNVNVSETLSAKLPKQLQPLAAPLAGGLRQLSEQAANQLLQRPRVQQLLRRARRLPADHQRQREESHLQWRHRLPRLKAVADPAR